MVSVSLSRSNLVGKRTTTGMGLFYY